MGYKSSFTLQTTAPLRDLTVKCNTFSYTFSDLQDTVTCTIPDSANQSEMDQIFTMNPGEESDDGEGHLIYSYSISIRQSADVGDNPNTRSLRKIPSGESPEAATWTINDIQLRATDFLPVFCQDNVSPLEMKQFYLYGWDGHINYLWINDSLGEGEQYTGNFYTDTPNPTSTSKLYTSDGTEIYHILASAGASMGDWYASDGIIVSGNTISFTCRE